LLDGGVRGDSRFTSWAIVTYENSSGHEFRRTPDRLLEEGAEVTCNFSDCRSLSLICKVGRLQHRGSTREGLIFIKVALASEVNVVTDAFEDAPNQLRRDETDAARHI